MMRYGTPHEVYYGTLSDPSRFDGFTAVHVTMDGLQAVFTTSEAKLFAERLLSHVAEAEKSNRKKLAALKKAQRTAKKNLTKKKGAR